MELGSFCLVIFSRNMLFYWCYNYIQNVYSLLKTSINIFTRCITIIIRRVISVNINLIVHVIFLLHFESLFSKLKYSRKGGETQLENA